MGGKVLELESERLFREGKTEGKEEGRAEGIELGIKQGLEQGLERGRAETIASLVKQGLLSVQEGARQLSISVSKMNAML